MGEELEKQKLSELLPHGPEGTGAKFRGTCVPVLHIDTPPRGPAGPDIQPCAEPHTSGPLLSRGSTFF